MPSPEATPARIETSAHADSIEVSKRTLRGEVLIEGTGIHSGAPCAVRLYPAVGGYGIKFARPGRPAVAASWKFADAEASDRRTVLVGEGNERFEQIEHLMAALEAMGISDALVEQQGPEVPFLGGGSREFMDALAAPGVVESGGRRRVLEIVRPIVLEDGNVLMVATPHNGLRLSVFVEFPGTVVGNAGFSLEVSEGSFHEEVSRARTFALARDLEMLRGMGLIKGGNLDNAVVFDQEKYYNESLYYPDEVVRHKIIDLLGDLALLNTGLRGHFWAWRAGHRSHVKFVQLLAREFKL